MPSKAPALAQKVLRPYQQRIISAAMNKNTIVLLPTGSGKTAIAAEVCRNLGGKALMLVPKIMLVTQQARAIQEWAGTHNVGQYHGGEVFPKDWSVLVSTPQSFATAQGRGIAPPWQDFKLVVFDEVHHVLKANPYRKLAHSLKRIPRNQSPSVLGLTASLTYAVGESKVKKSMENIYEDLRVDQCLTASEQELRADGYQGMFSAEVPIVDNIEWRPKGVFPESQRKPHLLLQTFEKRIARGEATSLSRSMVGIVGAMEKAIEALEPKFKSPRLHHSAVKQWGKCANSFAQTTKNKSARTMLQSLEHWYEALKTVIISWEEAEDACVTFLRMCGQEQPTQAWPEDIRVQLSSFWQTQPKSFPRFTHLEQVLIDLVEKHGKAFRGVLFVEQRLTTHILQHVIQENSAFAVTLRPACLYASGAPATASLKVSAQQSKKRLTAFATGEINLLIATTVAEEGMDIPAANCCIRFDPMHHSVSLVQGRGRARQANSDFVVMHERQDRPVKQLVETAQQQNTIASQFEPAPKNQCVDKQIAAQNSRERGAIKYLQDAQKSASSRSTLHLFCSKTKVVLYEQCRLAQGIHECTLEYKSVLRTLRSTATATTKKDAQISAAAHLIQQLTQSIHQS